MDTISTPATQPGSFEQVQFTGNAKEYFGIWIVNILLTIVTLGIYSAWAKVRRKRYFLGNTALLGRVFDYHATGKQILIGRLIVVGLLIVYNVLINFVPPLGAVLALVLFLAFPWLAVRSLRFNARVTSYLNVRFDFVGTVGGAFKAFLLGPVLATITLGVLAPLASRWAAKYITENIRFGGRAFSTDPSLKAIYVHFLTAVVIVIAGGFVLFLGGLAAGGANLDREVLTQVVASIVPLAGIVVLALAAIFYRIGVRNVVWSAMKFDGAHEFRSDVPRFGFFWLMVVNLLVTVITLGLMRPWAAVREARYMLEHTAVRLNGPIGDIMAQVQQSGSAVGSEYMDLEGFDIGFG